MYHSINISKKKKKDAKVSKPIAMLRSLIYPARTAAWDARKVA